MNNWKTLLLFPCFERISKVKSFEIVYVKRFLECLVKWFRINCFVLALKKKDNKKNKTNEIINYLLKRQSSVET